MGHVGVVPRFAGRGSRVQGYGCGLRSWMREGVSAEAVELGAILKEVICAHKRLRVPFLATCCIWKIIWRVSIRPSGGGRGVHSEGFGLGHLVCVSDC